MSWLADILNDVWDFTFTVSGIDVMERGSSVLQGKDFSKTFYKTVFIPYYY